MQLGACQKSAPEEDLITILPNDVVNNIMDRLPIQDAVRTSILSTNWRYKWTMISQVVFDREFIEYLYRTKRESNCCFDACDISRFLGHLDGVIKKFELYVLPPNHLKLEDCAKLLFEKKVKELTLTNMYTETPTEFPSPLYSCVGLKHLTLFNCWIPRRKSSFSGFPNLLSLHFSLVQFEGHEEYGEFIASCPLLETLIVNNVDVPTGKVKHDEIMKLENLSELFFSLHELYDDVAITCLDFFRLMASFPKLQRLTLDLQNCKFKIDQVYARNRFSSSLHGLKSLVLVNIDLDNRAMVFFLFHLIHNSPNLEGIRIMPSEVASISASPITYCEIEEGIAGSVQKLRQVELDHIQDSDNEVCLINSLLAHCSLLEKMFITTSPKLNQNIGAYLDFTKTLLTLPRASSKAILYFDYD